MKTKNHLQHIYLVRHGQASSLGSDLTRNLTALGQREIHTTGKHLAQIQPHIQYVAHSSRARAVETAHILGAELQLQVAPTELALLEPTEDPQKLLSWIELQEHNLLLVSHQPLLEGLLEVLLYKYHTDSKNLTPSFKNTGSAAACILDKKNIYIPWQFVPSDKDT